MLQLQSKYIILIIVLCLCHLSCTQHTNKNGGEIDCIEEIDIFATLSQSKMVNLSEIASNIEYCILETDEKCLVAGETFIYGSKDYILYLGEQCYVFDRKTGNFVRQISSKGHGPGEYVDIYRSFFDENNEQLCLLGNGHLLFYNLNGELSHQTILFPINNSVIRYGDLYISSIPNTHGNSTKRIAFYNKVGILIDSIPEYRTWKKSQSGSTGGFDGWLYTFHDNLYYKEIFSDTLFQIEDFKLQPRYIFNTGGESVPYKIQEGGRYDFFGALRGGREYDRFKQFVVLYKILESANYLYFTFDYKQFRYPAIYDKLKRKLNIIPPVSIPQFSRNMQVPMYGFKNDLDGGLPFWPKQMISEREMMCVYTAEELLGLDVSKITDDKLKNVLKSIDEESNPVIAIVTMKE